MIEYFIGGVIAAIAGLGLFLLTYFNQDKVKFKNFDQDFLINIAVFTSVLTCGLGALSMIMSGIYIGFG